MNCTESSSRLHDYVDGELSASEARALEAHVAQCDACRRQLDSLRAVIAGAAALPRDIAPQRDLWADLRREVEKLEDKTTEPMEAVAAAGGARSSRSTLAFRWFAPFAIAASIAILATVTEKQAVRPPDNRPAWSVSNLAGLPRVDKIPVEREARFRVGQWLETDAASRAKVTVGLVGEVMVDPNSRLRLRGVEETNHRLELERGTLQAFILAPPRIFFVDTPSATAVDMGCSYTLTVDDNGDGELHVTTGYVALEHGDRESIIPAGAKCLTRRGTGPGTPFADDAPAGFRAALKRFDFEGSAARTVLPELLTLARSEDAVTLWHFLTRTEGGQLADVFDALAKHHPPPEGVTRAGILAGDATMRHFWATALGFNTFGMR